MAIKIKALGLSNFRSFLGDHQIEFPDSGLILIKGESGIGKSTIFHAITYALGFNTIPVKDLQNWSDQSGPMSVRLTLDDNGKLVEISRSSKNSYLKINGQVVSTSNKEFEKNLNKYIGLDSSFRELLTYRDQFSPVKFTKLADAEKKSLLSELLGLRVLEEALDASNKDCNRMQAEVEGLQSVLDGMSKMVGPRPEVPVSRKDAIEAEIRAVESLENQESDAQRAADTKYLAEYNVQRSELESRLREIKPPDSDKAVLEAGTVLTNLKMEEARLQREDDDEFKRLMLYATECESLWKLHCRDLANLEDLLDKRRNIKVGECPTCRQEWDTQDMAASLETSIQHAKREVELSFFEKNKIDKAELAVENFRRSQRKHLALAPQIEEARKNLATAQSGYESMQRVYQAKVSELKAQIKSLEAERSLKVKPYVSPYQNRKSQLKSDLFRESQTIKMAEQAIVDWESQQTKIKAQKAKVEAAKTAWGVEVDWRDYLKGFLGRIFEEVLADIAQRANGILRNLPNTSSVTVEFQVQKASGKEAITPIYRFGGQEASLKSGASGGMATAIELAIDLALADTVSSRKGVSYGWLLLDESFNGFSQGVREEMLTILTSYAKDRLVAVVDHAGEMQAMFQSTIEITSEGLEWSKGVLSGQVN